MLSSCITLTLTVLLGSTTSIDSLDARLEQTRIRLSELEQQEAEVETLLIAIHEELETARQLYGELSRQETELSLSLEAVGSSAGRTDSLCEVLRESLQGYLVYTYSHRRLTGLEALFGEGGLSEALQREVYMDYLAHRAVEEYRRLRSSTDSLGRQMDSLSVLQQRVTVLRDRMMEIGGRIYLEEARQASLRSQIQTEIAAAAESASALESERQRLSRFVDDLRIESGAPQLPMVSGAPDSYFELNRGRVGWPASGSLVRRYGVEVHPVYGTETVCDGVWISTTASAPVVAVNEGSVLYASRFLSMGQMVIIDHRDGFYTIYGYMASTSVNEGQAVETGQEVGRAGTLPGGQAGVHFEIRTGGHPVNPESYLE